MVAQISEPRSGRRDRDDQTADGALVGRATAGDERAWEQIIARYTAYLASIGRSYRLSHEECSDALQDTWFNAVAHLGDLRDPGRLRPWLAMIMQRSCVQVMHQRRSYREQSVGDVADLVGGELRDEHADVEREVLAAERASVLYRALGKLPERQRALLHELISQDPSYDRISRQLGMPVGSIGPTRMRALRRLRSMLEQTNEGDLCRAA